MTTLNKSDFKIVYFHLPNQDEEEDLPKGCVVVHKPTGFAGVGEKDQATVKDNLISAFKSLVGKAKIPLEEISKLFSCPTCNQERLPSITNWKSDHSYEYGRIFTANDHPQKSKDVKFTDTPICAAIVYKNENDLYWYWNVTPQDVDESEEPLGFSQFVEDAIEEAEKHAIGIVEKSVKADELESQD